MKFSLVQLPLIVGISVHSKWELNSLQVLAAITYQIVPADTQYAEIPIAAVSSTYQQKVSF